jgi:hypothetical protein
MLAIPFLACNYTLESMPLWGLSGGWLMLTSSRPEELVMMSIVSVLNVLKCIIVVVAMCIPYCGIARNLANSRMGDIIMNHVPPCNN